MPEYKLSEAELYIMRCFWENGTMGTEALSELVAPRGWKPTTLLTFLSRLVKKDMLKVGKFGKTNVYSTLTTENDYKSSEGVTMLTQLYGGSARNFLAAMVQSDALSSKDINELRNWLNEQLPETETERGGKDE